MKNSLLWHPSGWDDYEYWLRNDKKILKKINELIKAIDRNPFEGMGKPEPLKFALQGFWSRRINHEHRLVYQFEKKVITVISCRYHYRDKLN